MAFMGHFGDGQALGGNRKLLGNRTRREAVAGERVESIRSI